MELNLELLNQIFARIAYHKLIVVSDTFFSGNRLRKILHTKGFELPFDTFTSADFKIAKKYGLYNSVLEELGVPPRDIIHIGDDFLLDVIKPTNCGINTLPINEFYD